MANIRDIQRHYFVPTTMQGIKGGSTEPPAGGVRLPAELIERVKNPGDISKEVKAVIDSQSWKNRAEKEAVYTYIRSHESAQRIIAGMRKGGRKFDAAAEVDRCRETLRGLPMQATPEDTEFIAKVINANAAGNLKGYLKAEEVKRPQWLAERMKYNQAIDPVWGRLNFRGPAVDFLKRVAPIELDSSGAPKDPKVQEKLNEIATGNYARIAAEESGFLVFWESQLPKAE